MELIYTMRRKSPKLEPPLFETSSEPEIIRPICTISSSNIIAFSSLTELSDADGDTWGGHVFVCDVNTPWETHKVISTIHPVSALEWDIEGKHLLVATTEGDVSVYGQKDYLLNDWICLYQASFPGEHIIKASFFHNGRRIAVVEKKPDAPITDRIQMLRHTPTLKGFGGVAVEGAIIVTGTGLIGALACPEASSGRALTATDGGPGRENVVAADIAHKAGTALVALAWRRGAARGVRVVACCVLSAAARAPSLVVTVQPLPAISLADDGLPVSVAWCLREESDSLLVAGGSLTLWQLAERALPVHKLLAKGPVQGSTTPGGGQKTGGDCFNTVVWQQTGMWAVEGGEHARCVACSKLPLGAPRAVLATARALHLVGRESHHYLCSRQVVTSGSPGAAAEATPSAGSTPPKKTKYGSGSLPSGARTARIAHAELGTFATLCVCIDTHAQIHVYKLPQPIDTLATPLSIQHASLLLEYSMVSGHDFLDVLISLKPNIIEALYERFTENFQRQPQTFQQYYFHHWLKIRIALCSMVACTARSAAALAALQISLATWAACTAGVRADERPDALDDCAHPDHDKSLLALEAKLDVPSEGGTVQALQALQPLRRPLERAVDTALTALAALPLPNQHHQPHSYELWSDPRALGVLRQLVAVARACGRGGDALSRPLARLAASAQLKNDLLEECASLTAQHPGRVWELLPRCGVAAPHGRPWPYYLEYGVEPEYLRCSPEPPPYAQCDFTPLSSMDAIRYMYLGGGRKATRWRQCSRCGARTLPASQPTKHPLQRAYDARFLTACKCGGKWTYFSNI